MARFEVFKLEGSCMSKLTIITINRNNSERLEKTMHSVFSQTRQDIEYVVVDGASTDGSVEVIRRYAEPFGKRMKWVSEPDSGVYNAMNKGIRMATGEYLQFLNSGDYLATDDVTERILAEIECQDNPPMLYGNLYKSYPNGQQVLAKGLHGGQITLLKMYRYTIHHNSTYIQRRLFEEYGFYDENLKIVSDWKWFLQVIVFGGIAPKYIDYPVDVYDMSGISSTNIELREQERHEVLKDLLPASILDDYERYSVAMEQFSRRRRYPLFFWTTSFLDRCLAKWESIRGQCVSPFRK